MPNWVTNDINIEGKIEDIEKFFEEVTAETGDTLEGYFSFQNLIPSSYGDDWREANINNWGVKWDASEDFWEIDQAAGTAILRFQTPWDIPLPIFNAMTEQYPKLSFWFEGVEEQGWGKKYSGENGILAIEEEWTIPGSHAEWIRREGECRECLWSDSEDRYADCPKDEDGE